MTTMSRRSFLGASAAYVAFLATGVIGLQLLGYTGWVQDAFYGGGLVLAVSVAAVVRRRVGVG